MSCWKQVRCELAQQQQQQHTTADYNKLADMNDGSNSNGTCSCHKQRRYNRLTCYRNGNSSGSNHLKALPLFITVAILALAVTPIDAAVMKRSIAETTTELNSTTPNTPLATIDENDSTTANTPLVANNSTTIENVQHDIATSQAVSESEMTTIGSSTVRHDDQILTSDTPQDVNNEIAQVVMEEAATDLRVKANPKFDYAETVLEENLEDSIRNSVRNEIEFEQDIVAAEVQHRQNVTDEEVRQKLAHEVQSIQNALQESSTKSSAAFDVLAELTSTTPDTERDQLSTTESTTFGHSKSVNNDLSVLFPLQTEETSKSSADNQRGARNLNINDNENAEFLNDNSDTNMQFNEDDGMQNIEEDKMEAQDGSLDADKSSLQAPFSRISESALYSHEANEIDEEGTIQKVSNGVQESQHNEDDTKLEDNNASASTEQHSVNLEEYNLSNEDSQPSASPSVVSVENHEAASSSASNEIVDTTQDHSTVPEENATIETTKNHYSPVDQNETKITPAVTDEASLSIVLDENLNATEATTALADDLTEDLLHLDESDALANEQVATTVEPESVKSVHTVIKKQGVELDEDIFEAIPIEPVEEPTTASVDIVKEELLEERETTAKSTLTSVDDIEIEKEQSIQNDDAANETSLQLDDKDDDQAISEPIEHITGQVVEENTQTNIEVDKLNEDNNQIDAEISEDDQVADSNSNPTTSEEITHSDDKQDALNDNQYLAEINNDIGSQTEKSSTTENIPSGVETPTEETEESAILEEAEEDNEITQRSSTTESMIAQETEDEEKTSEGSSTTERSGQMHISLLDTTHLPNAEVPHTSTATIERQSTTLKEFEVIDEADNNTDDPDIVPLLVGVSTGQGDVTASTKGSRSINTQTHHTMLLTQLDDTMAATLFETFPPHNAGRTLNDHMAAESSGGIGKPLPTRSINEVTSASIFSRSGLIIVVCSSIAFMFLLVSVVAFLISFQRQHGTLDIEMQEQRCGKDDLDEEDEEAGTCTKLLEIELPKSTIVSASCEELEECL